MKHITKHGAQEIVGLLSLTANQHVWLSVKNTSGTGDLTINSANVNISRLI